MNALEAHIESHAIDRQTKDDPAWAIELNGHRLRTMSGKSLWRTIGHAKSAFKQHLQNCPGFVNEYIELSGRPADSISSKAYSSSCDVKYVFDDLCTRGNLRFVDLPSR